jgi:hypothetical protein
VNSGGQEGIKQFLLHKWHPSYSSLVTYSMISQEFGLGGFWGWFFGGVFCNPVIREVRQLNKGFNFITLIFIQSSLTETKCKCIHVHVTVTEVRLHSLFLLDTDIQ